MDETGRTIDFSPYSFALDSHELRKNDRLVKHHLPSATHSYRRKRYEARFVLTKVTEHFDRYLGPGPRPASPRTEQAEGPATAGGPRH